MDCFVACAPLRKRFAFVAGNDGEVWQWGFRTAENDATYSAASDITDTGARLSQPSRNRFSQARSATS
jgi:hypothetical protein